MSFISLGKGSKPNDSGVVDVWVTCAITSFLVEEGADTMRVKRLKIKIS